MSRFWSLDAGENNVLEIMHEIDSDKYWETQKVTGANEFRQALARCAGPMNVLINSPGGDTFAGADMYTALREYSAQRGRVTCYVTGIAASAASLVAMAGDEIVISDVGMMMIHDPWTLAVGNAGELRELADVLDTVRDAVAAAYVKRTGLSAQRVREMMASERYMTADEAIADGFADRKGVYAGARPQGIASAIRTAMAEDALAQLQGAAKALKACVLGAPGETATAGNAPGETEAEHRAAAEQARARLRLRARCI